jgi:hypothetical protein
MLSKNLLRLVCCCGLHCGLCAHRNRIPHQARQLQKSLHEEEFDDWYKYAPDLKDSFSQFWQFLRNLATLDCTYRTGGGPPCCKIRQCAKQKSIEICLQCKEYPCQLITALAEYYPTIIQDGKRLQKIGLENWVNKQEERAKRGFVYADTRVS